MLRIYDGNLDSSLDCGGLHALAGNNHKLSTILALFQFRPSQETALIHRKSDVFDADVGGLGDVLQGALHHKVEDGATIFVRNDFIPAEGGEDSI